MEETELSLLGKRLGVYTPRGGKSYVREDFENFMKRYQLYEWLRLIGELSHRAFFMQMETAQQLDGVPISDSVLAYLAMRAVESSNDFRGNAPALRDLAKVADMYWGLPDPIENDGEVYSCLLRFGNSQFDYQRRLDNLLPRSFAIYRDLWSRVADTVDINSVVEKIAGCGIEDVLMFTFAFTGQSLKSGGYFRLYTGVDSTDAELVGLFAREKQERFVNWLSCDYGAFRSQSRAHLKKLPGPKYEKERFNPLLKHPILKPDCNPLPGAAQVYIVPVPRLVHERVTRGLYFELSDHFMGSGKSNPFKQSFGSVFQEYVGELLKDAVGSPQVLSEFKYGKEEKLTPDWMVVDGDQCILIEVKRAGLYLNAKMWGEIDDVKKDLSQSVGAGVRQLWKFEQAIQSGKYSELNSLLSIKRFHRLIVSYDNLYYANWILKDKIKEVFTAAGDDVPADYDWQIISIDELEFVLGMHGTDFVKVLNHKQSGSEDSELDFGDYLSKYYSDRSAKNPYLEGIKERFFSRFETPKV